MYGRKQEKKERRKEEASDENERGNQILHEVEVRAELYFSAMDTSFTAIPLYRYTAIHTYTLIHCMTVCHENTRTRARVGTWTRI